MQNRNEIKKQIFQVIDSLTGDQSKEITDETRLFGEGQILDSMKLVELCLILEDMAAELGFEFDWTSETALSKSFSMFRTAGALAAEFAEQLGRKE